MNKVLLLLLCCVVLIGCVKTEIINTSDIRNETTILETDVMEEETDLSKSEKDIETAISVEGSDNMIGLPEKYVESFNSACGSCGLELQKLNNFKKLADWNNGERYSFEYNGNIYLLYLMDTGEVMSISDSATRTKIYEYNSASGGTKDNCITLKYGEIGEYGKEEDFDGYKEIRYYIPSGAYTVKCQTRGSGLYLESIETHLEDGYKTSDVLKDIKFSSTDEEYEIEVSDGACITLLLNSIVELRVK